MSQIRDYTSHRDVRPRYYDTGRIAVAAVGAEWHRHVDSAFAEMLVLAQKVAQPDRMAGRLAPTIG